VLPKNLESGAVDKNMPVRTSKWRVAKARAEAADGCGDEEGFLEKCVVKQSRLDIEGGKGVGPMPTKGTLTGDGGEKLLRLRAGRA